LRRKCQNFHQTSKAAIHLFWIIYFMKLPCNATETPFTAVTFDEQEFAKRFEFLAAQKRTHVLNEQRHAREI